MVASISWPLLLTALAINLTQQLWAEEPDWFSIFEHPNPVALFQSKTKAFELQSDSRLVRVNHEGLAQVFQAHSHLVFQHIGHFNLSRKLMINEAPLELRAYKHRYFLSLPDSGLATAVPLHTEMKRWIHVSLKELLDVFEQADFADLFSRKPFETSATRVCFREVRGAFCFDSVTRLPIEGQLTLEISPGTTLQTRFIIKLFKDAPKDLLKP